MNDLSKAGQVLGREEMKKIMAGNGGNIKCSIWGIDFNCNLDTLLECTESCADLAGSRCNGCAQFPELEEHP